MERKAAELAETQRKNASLLQDQLEIFKSNLHQFARKYAKEIRTDPRFRMQFQRMCQIAGVDPLVYKDKDKGKHSNEIIEDDIKRAIKQLQPLGGGYQVITLGSRKMVQSAPREMNKDQTNLLVLAQDNGYFTVRLVEEKYRWNHDRIQNSLDAMLRDGLVWLDDQIRPNQYWVPAYFFS
ncbi:ESCRT II complex subunit Dot2 [Mycoemilia scoparia]|uniref:ESCRT II complex subunit Dot2 n=1 Tax=Mycoemilia scoparia TaxID=417184 RepID=A0A9W7ZW77_9FUNG|nr:ESCRT II complex subunit Dot2 [Mycoemilia scoparia]